MSRRHPVDSIWTSATKAVPSLALGLCLTYWIMKEAVSTSVGMLRGDIRPFTRQLYPISHDIAHCSGYRLTEIMQRTESGLRGALRLISPCAAFGNDIQDLVIEVDWETESRLHVHIFDKDRLQWQIPDDVWPRAASSPHTVNGLRISWHSDPFEFWITRDDGSGQVIFDTRSGSIPKYKDVMQGMGDHLSNRNNTAMRAHPLVFEDQYLQISSALPRGAHIYGLGEVSASSGFRRDSSNTLQPLWNADRGVAQDSNIYGSFPFYLEQRIEDGKGTAHGVFLLSSSPMDILLRDQVIQYRVVGGTLDFYFYSGPTPLDVIKQHTENVGFSHMPPRFALGFNLCKYGWRSLDVVQDVVKSMRDANIPLETIWSDIDHMDGFRDFTLDSKLYPADRMATFIEQLHTDNQHFVPIVDAAINLVEKQDDRYDVFTSGLERDVYMKTWDGKNYYGQVWPGGTAFPDFFAKNAQAWWNDAFRNFTALLDYSGIWNDMSEPASFCSGPCYTGSGKSVRAKPPFPDVLPDQYKLAPFPDGYDAARFGYSGNMTVNGVDTYNSGFSAAYYDSTPVSAEAKGKVRYVSQPAYSIHNFRDFHDLGAGTVAPDAKHANGATALEAHNIYGYMFGQATYNALLAVHPKRRPHVINRSTFSKSGMYTGHWTGDNWSTWTDIKRSIQGILQFQMFGIPLVGADVCGFGYNTNEELCNRWMSLGAMTPWFRNHNQIGAIDQEPYRWDSVAEASRRAIALRYRLLPYWYTLFAEAHQTGAPVVNALSWIYPDSESLLHTDEQYFIGSHLLVAPVLRPNERTVKMNMPLTAGWRDWYTHEELTKGTTELDAPLSHVPVLIRGGFASLLYNKPSYTIAETVDSGFDLLVSLDAHGVADGRAYVDDGITYPAEDGRWLEIKASRTSLAIMTTRGQYNIQQNLHDATLLGVDKHPSMMFVNGHRHTAFKYDVARSRLHVTDLNLSLNGPIQITWQ